jgi:hypothetical protein
LKLVLLGGSGTGGSGVIGLKSVGTERGNCGPYIYLKIIPKIYCGWKEGICKCSGSGSIIVYVVVITEKMMLRTWPTVSGNNSVMYAGAKLFTILYIISFFIFLLVCKDVQPISLYNLSKLQYFGRPVTIRAASVWMLSSWFN